MTSNFTPLPAVKTRSFWHRPAALPAIVFLLGLVLAGACAMKWRDDINEVAQAEFQRTTHRVSSEIRRRFNLPIYGLNGLKSVYTSHAKVTRAAFIAAVQSRDLAKEFPGVRGFGFIERVARANLGAFVAAEQADAAPDFAIRQLGDKELDDLFVVKYLEPARSNGGVRGLDIGSEGVRRTAAQQVVDTGEPLMTDTITLVKVKGQRPGVLVFVPVYAQGADLATVQGRRASLVGLLFAPMVFDELFAGVNAVTASQVDFEILKTAPDSALIFTSQAQRTPAPLAQATAQAPRFVSSQPERLVGRDLTLRITSTPEFDAAIDHTTPWLVFAAGALLSALLALFLRNQAQQLPIIQAIVDKRTAELNQERARLQFILDALSQRESALKESEQKLFTILESVEASIYLKDIEGRYLFANRSVRDLFGKTHNEIIGQSDEQFFDAATIATIRSNDNLVLKEGRTLKTEETNRNLKDGRESVFLSVKLPLRHSNGEIYALCGISTDITERKRMERVLQVKNVVLEHARAQADTANLAKSDFLSSMSHEIRSPLNAILGLAYLLEQANLDADAIQMVSKIRASGSMLLGLISDILDVSKIEAGQMMIEQAPFRLTHVIDNLANVLSVAVGAKEIKLIIEPAPAGVGSLIGDALRLEQVLLNLSINAIKFTSVGQVALRTELLSDTFEAVTLKFSVHDTGIGIAPALQGSVFAAFTQADSSTTRRFGGTGLGLTICRQLVHLMGGEIGVNSVLGQGSEFWFTVTLQKAADADVADVPDPVGTPLALAPPNGQSLLGLRVLVTDDSEINCEVARRILQGQGAIVSLASNGQEALDWLLAHPTEVDLVLMDVQMPVLDGLEATRQLRRMPEFAELPIVALTAGAFKSQQDEARAVGMTHFISKPFDVPSTLALIQRLCRRPAPSPQPQAPAAPTPAPSELVMDVAQGLEIWMDMPSYLDCLPRFVKSYHDAVAVMQASLAQGDRAGAIALAHKLAGDAANMALPDTRRLAAQAERVLRSELDPAPALADLALALARALAEIESLCTPTEGVYKANQAVAPVDTA